MELTWRDPPPTWGALEFTRRPVGRIRTGPPTRAIAAASATCLAARNRRCGHPIRAGLRGCGKGVRHLVLTSGRRGHDGAVTDVLAAMIRRAAPADVGVLPGTPPVVAFGDPLGATSATLGINPSWAEYLGRDGQ